MALLIAATLPTTYRNLSNWSAGWLMAATLLFYGLPKTSAQTPVDREYQIKAAFLFNFTQFVEWPPGTFPSAGSPLIIGVLGDDPFGPALDAAVKGEKSGGHPLTVRRCRDVSAAGECQVLFVSQSEAARLEPILAALQGRAILTVGDYGTFAKSGGMIRFLTVNNKIRLRINLEAAKAANLVISSKLLRPAEIVTTEKPNP